MAMACMCRALLVSFFLENREGENARRQHRLHLRNRLHAGRVRMTATDNKATRACVSCTWALARSGSYRVEEAFRKSAYDRLLKIKGKQAPAI